MNPTIQSVEKSEQYESSDLMTLEEVDILCRKCNHLHDEEILKTLGKIWHKIIGNHSYEEGVLHHDGVK